MPFDDLGKLGLPPLRPKSFPYPADPEFCGTFPCQPYDDFPLDDFPADLGHGYGPD